MTNSQQNLNQPEETRNTQPTASEKFRPAPTAGSTVLFVLAATVLAILAIAGFQKLLAPAVPATITSTSTQQKTTPPVTAPTEGITYAEASQAGVLAADGDAKITGYQVTTTEEGVQFRVTVQNISEVAEKYEVVATGDKGAFQPVGGTLSLEPQAKGTVLVEVERLPQVTTAITLSLNGTRLGVGVDEEVISLASP